MVGWRRHLFYTKQCVRTTWKLRLGVLVVATLALAATSRIWTSAIARSLVCAQDVGPSDLVLVENFDPSYVLFERAAALQKAGLAPRTLVLVQVSQAPGVANPIFRGIAEIMARQARLETWEVLPIQEIEPISLNAAAQIRDHLARERVKSLIVVTRGFRSRRSALIYTNVLHDAGMEVRCDPVFGRATPEHWTATWHGMQEITEEFLKLQYYRFYVLPFLAHRSSNGRA